MGLGRAGADCSLKCDPMEKLRKKILATSPVPIPPVSDSLAFFRSFKKPSMVDVLQDAKVNHKLLFQARSGVGDSNEMKRMLSTIAQNESSGVATLTIDSLTRNNQWQRLNELMEQGNIAQLNGFPLVTHGYHVGRSLHEHTPYPIQVRHGSPDAAILAEIAYASGVTGFEGGGISYNLPYAKNVPLADSLHAWRYVDWLTGMYQSHGINLNRETFGPLTAVIVPPSIAIAISLIESLLMVKEGVKHISLSFGQTGVLQQDVATAQVLRQLASKLLPTAQVTLCMHMWMGVFPRSIQLAQMFVHYGVKVAYACGVERVIIKTPVEAFRIPKADESRDALRFCQNIKRPITSDSVLGDVEQEVFWLKREVEELLLPLLEAPDLTSAIVCSFENGTLDIPFSPSIHTKSWVVPLRDPTGCIRYHNFGQLPFSNSIKQYHNNALKFRLKKGTPVDNLLQDDIHYISKLSAADIKKRIEVL